MFDYVKSVCDYCYEKSISLTLSVLGIAGVLLGGSNAMAQSTPAEVNVVPPNINWTNVTQQLLTALTGVVVVAIGVGLSIWALTMVVKLFKSNAHG